MELVLSNSTSDKRRVYKNAGTATKIYSNVHLKHDTSVINPTFVLTGVGTDAGLPKKFNYCYCAYLRRYYFIKDIRYCRGEVIEIDCHVDVLHTYSDYIYSHGAFVERSEKEFYKKQDSSNGIFFDPEYPIRADAYIWTEQKLEFGCVANSKSYYLTVNGGVMS